MRDNTEIDMAPRRKKKKPFDLFAKWPNTEAFPNRQVFRWGCYANQKARDQALRVLSSENNQWSKYGVRFAVARCEL